MSSLRASSGRRAAKTRAVRLTLRSLLLARSLARSLVLSATGRLLPAHSRAGGPDSRFVAPARAVAFQISGKLCFFFPPPTPPPAAPLGPDPPAQLRPPFCRGARRIIRRNPHVAAWLHHHQKEPEKARGRRRLLWRREGCHGIGKIGGRGEV